MVTCSDGLRDLSSVTSSLEVLLSNSLFDSINLVLVSLSVSHSAFFSFFKGSFKSLKNIIANDQILKRNN